MDKKQKVKKWIKNNGDVIVGSIMGGITVMIGFKLGQRYTEKALAEGIKRFHKDGFIKFTLPSGVEPAHFEDYVDELHAFYDKK